MKKTEIALLVLLIAGLIDSAYLSLVELGTAPLYCPQSSIINCNTVLSSKYSIVFGVQLAYIAFAWFAISVVLFAASQLYRKVTVLRQIWFVFGLGGVIYSFVSMNAIGLICEYCFLLDVLLIAIAGISIYQLL